MLKKFVEGLVFGGGFAISFIAIWYVAAFLITPMFVASVLGDAGNQQVSELNANSQPASPGFTPTYERGKPFHELEVAEQIRKSSAIALARYERAPDGRMKAIIKEFLKKEPNVTIYYDIGDEFSSASHYPKENTSYGDGVILFFTGSPATMKMSMTYSDGRIGSLGDMPVALFRMKCKDPNA